MTNIIVNISPPKCGTTSLYFALAASREIASSAVKEPRFFAAAGERDERGLPDALRTGGNFANGREWHDALFAGEAGERYRIDFTTYYAITRDTPRLLRSIYPNPKLIFVMRDPVRRFVSHYYQYAKMGIRLPPIEQAIRGDNPISGLLYAFSNYADTYQRFAAEFGRDAILTLDFADFARTPEAIAAACNRFLGTDDIVYAPSEREKNVAGNPRFKALQQVLFSDSLRTLLRHVPPAVRVRLLRTRKQLVLANVKAEEYPPLDPALHEVLADRLQPQFEFYRAKCGDPPTEAA